MKVTLTPSLNVKDQRDYVANVNAEANVTNDIRLGVRCSDATFGNRGHGGVSARDVHVRMSVGGDADNRMKNSNGLCIDYDVDNNAPTVEINTGVNVRDKSVRMAWRHGMRKNSVNVRAEVDLDDKTRLRINYQPDAERFNIRECVNEMDLNCRYELDDNTTIEPGVNMRNKSFNLRVQRRLDDNQKVHLHFDSHTRDGVVGFTRHMNDGDLNVRATMNLGDGMGRNMPAIHIQKEWSIDLGN